MIVFRAREVSALIRGDAERFVRDMGGDLLSTLVFATPVGNPTLWQNPNSAPPGYVGGHARRNWQVGLNNATPRGERPGEDKSGQPTIAEGRAKMKGFKLGGSIVIANNAPYMGRLNDGYSTQAPRLFVERAISRVVRTARLRARRK